MHPIKCRQLRFWRRIHSGGAWMTRDSWMMAELWNGRNISQLSHSIPCMHQAKPSKCHLRCFHDWCFIYLHIFPMFLPRNFSPVILPVPAAHKISSLASPKPRVPGSNRSHLAKDLWWNSGAGWGYHGISGYPTAWSQPLKQFSLLWMNHSSHITKALFFGGCDWCWLMKVDISPDSQVRNSWDFVE